jgi:tetratricopeptide (TPR) repeat protein
MSTTPIAPVAHHRPSLRARASAFLGLCVRFSMIGTGVLLMGWAAVSSVGCASGKTYTKQHASGAKVKMNGLKAATEHQMALQAFHAGDLAKARRHNDFSINLNPEVVRTHLLRGRIMLELGDVEAAGAAFTKAQELGPDDAEVRYFQGLLHERVGETSLAIEAFEKACELDPANPQYAIAAAENMINQREVARAEAFLAQRADRFKHNAGIRHLRGHVELVKGDPRAAARLFAEARLLAPDDPAILEDLARAQLASGEPGQADSTLQRLLNRPDMRDRRDLKFLRANCLVQLDRPADARTLLIDLTSTDEGANDTAAWALLAKVSLDVNDVSRARTAASRVVALAPTSPEGHVLRALALRRQGDLTAAQASIERAILIKPDAQNLTILGMILADAGNTDAAARAYAKALEIEPTYELAQRMQLAMQPGTAPAVTDAQGQ